MISRGPYNYRDKTEALSSNQHTVQRELQFSFNPLILVGLKENEMREGDEKSSDDEIRG